MQCVLNFKREEPEKKIWGERNQKEEKDFQNERGYSTFHVKFRDRKWQNLGFLETN